MQTLKLECQQHDLTGEGRRAVFGIAIDNWAAVRRARLHAC